MNVLDFRAMKTEGRKISMVTCYDHALARVVNDSAVDAVLVGDSVAMVMHGHPSTLQATPEMMALHTAAVARGAPSKFVVADLPFLSYRRGRDHALGCVDQLMKAGAHAVKLEGVRGHEDVVEAIVQSGVPVMGHIGLTPQSIYGLGGFKVQGRDDETARELEWQAERLEQLGCFAIVLECVPSIVAARVTGARQVPTIGIGAGLDCDGQVLVLQDLLGLNPGFRPKFLRHFLDGAAQVKGALDLFHREVTERTFPNESESYR
jgi:3-methyl-2-oxobutanoate hydroxymethyltransferase